MQTQIIAGQTHTLKEQHKGTHREYTKKESIGNKRPPKAAVYHRCIINIESNVDDDVDNGGNTTTAAASDGRSVVDDDIQHNLTQKERDSNRYCLADQQRVAYTQCCVRLIWGKNTTTRKIHTKTLSGTD